MYLGLHFRQNPVPHNSHTYSRVDSFLQIILFFTERVAVLFKSNPIWGKKIRTVLAATKELQVNTFVKMKVKHYHGVLLMTCIHCSV